MTFVVEENQLCAEDNFLCLLLMQKNEYIRDFCFHQFYIQYFLMLYKGNRCVIQSPPFFFIYQIFFTKCLEQQKNNEEGCKKAFDLYF